MCFPLFAAGIVVDIINHFEKIGLDLDCFFLEKIGLFFLGIGAPGLNFRILSSRPAWK